MPPYLVLFKLYYVIYIDFCLIMLSLKYSGQLLLE